MITVDVNTKSFDDSLKALSKRMANLRPVMASIGAILETQVRNRRESRTDPDGEAWAPWAASTIATYPADGYGQLLDRSGAMWDKTGPQWRATADSVRVGFDKGYSTYHEFGTRHMPRRGLLLSDADAGTLGEDDEAEIEAVLQKWLDRAL